MLLQLMLAPRTTFTTTFAAVGMDEQMAEEFRAKRDPIWVSYMTNIIKEEANKLAVLEPAGSC